MLALIVPLGSSDSRRGTIVFVHGAPTQSYSYRVVMAQVLFMVPLSNTIELL